MPAVRLYRVPGLRARVLVGAGTYLRPISELRSDGHNSVFEVEAAIPLASGSHRDLC